MLKLQKSILALVIFFAILGSGLVVLAQPTTPTGNTNIAIDVPVPPAPTTPPTVNFDNLSDSVTKNVQKRLDETMRAEEWKHKNMRQVARGAVYGIVAILFVAFSIFNKRKSKRRKK